MCRCTEGLSRRDALKTVAAVAAAMAAGGFPLGFTKAADAPGGANKKVLFYTRSAGFQHDVVKRPDNNKDDVLSYAEKAFTKMAKENGVDLVCTKDGSIFTPEKLAAFDGIAFYTTGDLEKEGGDKTPPMPKGGRDALVKFIESGKGFFGFHCATDTFGKHMGSGDGEKTDNYIKMVGAEFDGHNAQQKSKIRVVGGFSPIKDVKDFEKNEEWYRFKNIAPDMHVILVQETGSMREQVYKDRKPYPMTWARMQGKGRVFYTSMGHREDVWTSDEFKQVVLGGLSWALGHVQADVKPNLREACPEVEKVRPAEANA
jgi:type 1 glutamine amidotransferase